MSLVLASASTSRAALLRAAGVAFTVAPADLDEGALMARLRAQGADAGRIAFALARDKALAVSRRHPDALVLGGDTVIAFQEEILSKVPDLAAARALLQRLAGQAHLLVSASALARDGGLVWDHAEQVCLTMRDFSAEFLEEYLAEEGEALLSSVGCYRFEGLGAQLFEKVEGDYFSVLGLPLLPVLAALRDQGEMSS